jgi:putative ABC transport system permease protein
LKTPSPTTPCSSPAAQQWLQPKADAVELQVGTNQLKLRVAGPVLRARAGQRIAVMDIGAAQWRFEKLGQLSRIDLKLRDGVNRETFKAQLQQDLQRQYPGRFRVNQPNDEEQNNRNEGMSRAYRVNLTVLALVALFTGAFLVFSTQALSVIRRRSQFALLRAGHGPPPLLHQILLEGLCLGVAGSAIGIAAGYGMAATALHFMGADLGAGFFSGVRPRCTSRRLQPPSTSRWASPLRCWAAPRRRWTRPAPSPPSRSNPAPRKRPCRASRARGRRC